MPSPQRENERQRRRAEALLVEQRLAKRLEAEQLERNVQGSVAASHSTSELKRIRLLKGKAKS